MRKGLWLAAACGFLLAPCVFGFQAAGGYHLLQKIPLEAAAGGGEYFDYITFDAAARRIYLSHGTEVDVVDADNGHLAGKVTGLKRDHGIAIAPELGRGFISDGKTGRVVIFNLKTLKKVGRVKTAKDADSILYEPVTKRIFVFSGTAKLCTVIDPKKRLVVTTLATGGAPEQAVADGKGMIYDNLEDKNEVIAIDAKELRIVARWPVAPAGQPVAIAMDREHRRLFIAGRKPQSLVVMNPDYGAMFGDPFPIGARVDTAVFDAETGMVAVSTGEGTIEIFHEDAPDKFSAVETVKTEFGAKTMALDPKTHHLLVDTAEFDPPEASPKDKQPPQPKPRPGTFHLLIYGR